MIVFIKVYCHTSRYFCCFLVLILAGSFALKSHVNQRIAIHLLVTILVYIICPVFLAFKGMFLLNNLPLLSALSYGYH